MKVRIARRCLYRDRVGNPISRLFVEVDGKWYMPSWRVYKSIFPSMTADPTILGVYIIDEEQAIHQVVPDLKKILTIDLPKEIVEEIRKAQSPLMPVLTSEEELERTEEIYHQHRQHQKK